MIARDKEGQYIMIKRSIQEEDTLIVNIYTPYTHYLMGNRWRDSGNSSDFHFWAPKSLQMVTAAMKLKGTYSLEGKL